MKDKLNACRKLFLKTVEYYMKMLLFNSDFELTHWIGDEIGEIAVLNDEIYMSFSDIRYCVDNGIPVAKYAEYQWYVIERHFRKDAKDRYAEFKRGEYLASSPANFENWMRLGCPDAFEE